MLESLEEMVLLYLIRCRKVGDGPGEAEGRMAGSRGEIKLFHGDGKGSRHGGLEAAEALDEA